MQEQLRLFGLHAVRAIVLFALFRRSWRRPVIREIMLLLFTGCMAGVLLMTLQGSWAAPSQMLLSARSRLASLEKINLLAGETLHRTWYSAPDSPARKELIGNFVLFMPWGFFLPLLWHRWRSFFRMTAMCLLLTCAIESIQLFIDRTVDIDDIIVNFLGSMSGAALWWLLHRLFPATERLSSQDIR